MFWQGDHTIQALLKLHNTIRIVGIGEILILLYSLKHEAYQIVQTLLNLKSYAVFLGSGTLMLAIDYWQKHSGILILAISCFSFASGMEYPAFSFYSVTYQDSRQEVHPPLLDRGFCHWRGSRRAEYGI